jgi:hypothetical protein
MLPVIYTFDKSITAIPWCVGGIALLVGIILIRRSVRLRFKVLPFLIGLIALTIFGPSMQSDRIEITSESFYLRTGAWWSPNEHRFSMRDALGIEIITIADLKGRPNKYMRVALKSGAYDDVPMGDLFRLHEQDILTAVTDAMKSATSK